MSNMTQLRRIERLEERAAAEREADPFRPIVEIVIVDHETRDGRVVAVTGEIGIAGPDAVRFGDLGATAIFRPVQA